MTQVTEAPAPSADAVVSLREITSQTLRPILKLSVAPAQQQFVANNAVSIAQAHFEPQKAWFRAVYADETPVGFVMLSDDPVKPEYYLWRFMIDQRYQRSGFGRRAIELLIEHVRQRPGARELLTSCVPGDGTPIPFYEKLGFALTGDKDEDELVMKRKL